jgi:hypothetical protein
MLDEHDVVAGVLPGDQGGGVALACRASRVTTIPARSRLILDIGGPELITGSAPMRYWERDPYLWTLQDMRTVYDPVANQTTSFLRYEKWRPTRGSPTSA